MSQTNCAEPRHFDIAILGGGFAGVYAARRVAKRLGHLHLKIGLIASENHMVFQPMLPEVVGGSLSPRHVVNPIRLICRDLDVLKGKVCSVDLVNRKMIVDGGAFSSNVCVTFDHLVFALGSEVDLTRIPGMSEHAHLLRNCGDAMKLRAAIIARMEEANLIPDVEERRRLLSFVVVGGGYSGVETAGQMQDLIRGVCRYYDHVEPGDASVTLVHSGDRLLPMLDPSLGDYTARCLEKMGLKVVLNQRVRAATARTVLLNDGTKISASLVVCTVGNAPHPLLKTLGEAGAIPLERGRVVVEPTGRVVGHDRLWAAGDCAAFPKIDGGLCPETAQFALRQGELVGDNIAASRFDYPLETFKFTGLGELASIGHHMAVANVAGINFSGLIAWFMWRTIYLSKLPGLDRKLRVLIEWTFELFFPRDISLLTPQYTTTVREMHLEPGDPLFESGDPAFSLYAVKKGLVNITDDSGEVIKAAGPGDHFGERALLGDRIWRFDATAAESSELVAIEARTFDKLIGINSLRKVFLKSAEEYHLPEEVDQTLATMPANVQQGVARDVMTTEIIAISSKARLTEAIDEFQKHPHSSYPVVDDQGKVLGLLRRAAAYDWLKHNGLDGQHQVGEVPLGQAFVVQPETPVAELINDLMHSGATKALVIDAEGQLHGMITVYDLLKHSRKV
jgi:NADH:ubiquinone reductase (H+-translocating)